MRKNCEKTLVLWEVYREFYRGLPSRELTYPTKREKENHLQNAIFLGYVSSLEGNRSLWGFVCVGLTLLRCFNHEQHHHDSNDTII